MARASTMLTTRVGTVRSDPITMKVAPVSPRECVKERITPARIPLFNRGREIVSVASYGVAPSVLALSSYERISDPSYAAIVGSVMTGTENTM